MKSEIKFFEELLDRADIRINGSRSWDIRIYAPKMEMLFERIIHQGTLGLGEAYMDVWWDCECLEEFFIRILRLFNGDPSRQLPVAMPFILNYLKILLPSILLNRQNRRRAHIVGKRHYDAGNDLFQKMLGKTMAYSCGYWKDAKTLDEAQEAKLDLICRKLHLDYGMRLLDIGCGWGSLAEYAARNYGTNVVGITISQEQAKFAQERCHGLPVEIRLQDYRGLDETFDAIASVGMFEHVGSKNYPIFMKTVHRCLTNEGLFLLHTIGGNRQKRHCDPWFDKYIFPNGMLPSIEQPLRSAKGLFIVEDFHSFGAHYSKTLREWYRNFIQAWPELRSAYDERFYRMWCYYLTSLTAAFYTRHMQVWQFAFAKRYLIGGYESIR